MRMQGQSMKPFPLRLNPQNADEAFMLEALKEAWKAFQKGEVPVGAVIVKEGKVIARGHNQVEMLNDATAHAEMLSLTVAESYEQNWRLKGATMYATLEPCCMCAGALFLTRVDKLVFGAPDIRHGAFGSFVDLLAKPHPTHTLEVVRGVLDEESAHLMREFFKKRRLENAAGNETEALNGY